MNKTLGTFLVVIFCFFLMGTFVSQRVGAELLAEGWSKTYGGAGEEVAHALVQVNDGGYVLAGATGSWDTDEDVLLVRTDADGNALWNKTYGGTGLDWAEALVQTDDGGYATAGPTSSRGTYINDFWLVKTDANGNPLWNKTYGGASDDVAEALIETGDGGYAMTGPTQSFCAGNYDFWLVRTDASGNALWNRTYGGTGLDWSEALVQTNDGGYAIAGATWSFGARNGDVWLVRTDSSGNALWNNTYGGAKADMAHALIQTDDGGYAIAGYTESYGAGASDFWLVKTDAYGNMQWNKTYGGTSQDWPQSMVQTGDGGYAIVGYTESQGSGLSDAWFVKTDALGNMQWNKTYGGASADWSEALVQTGDGGYALSGRTASFGAGNYDFWLVRTDPSGKVPEFPSMVIPIVLVTAITFAVLLTKRRPLRIDQKLNSKTRRCDLAGDEDRG